MVEIPSPPPTRPLTPRFRTLPIGTSLTRIYGTKYLGPVSYNHNGPRGRFDHHRASSAEPADDPERGIYYAADDLTGCIIEVFGDTGVVDPTGYGVAVVETTKSLRLLDLRGDGAWYAGTVAAVTQDSDRSISQEWARYFYQTYADVDGVAYNNAHDNAAAYALFERSGPLRVIEDHRLESPLLKSELQALAIALGLIPPM